MCVQPKAIMITNMLVLDVCKAYALNFNQYIMVLDVSYSIIYGVFSASLLEI